MKYGEFIGFLWTSSANQCRQMKSNSAWDILGSWCSPGVHIAKNKEDIPLAIPFILSCNLLHSHWTWPSRNSEFSREKRWIFPVPYVSVYLRVYPKYSHHTWYFHVLLTGWWFGTFFIFPFSWECHHPRWLSYFSEG